MATARSSHTATLLPSGKVLVTGGQSASGTEHYDPTSNTWSAAGSMATPRVGHTATLLPSGEVLVAGGAGTSAEVYDPASNTWSAAGSMATARGVHTATLLPTGKVLVAGGSGASDFLASAEVYDPASNMWSVAGSMATRRAYHTATLLFSGQVLVAGGETPLSSHIAPPTFASAELYDPASNTWGATGSMAVGRAFHSATLLLPSGQVLVAGGEHTFNPFSNMAVASAELYDPASSTWGATGSMTTPREFHTATLLLSGKVLVAGGFGANHALASAELYDPASVPAPILVPLPTSVPTLSQWGLLILVTLFLGLGPIQTRRKLR